MEYIESSPDSEVEIIKPVTTAQLNEKKRASAQQSLILALQRKDEYAIQDNIEKINELWERCNKKLD